jgi:hypothetical protein
VTWLIIYGAIHGSKWQEAPLGDTVAKSRRYSFQCDRYRDWFNINDIDHVVKVSCNINIGATIDKAAGFTINHAYLYVEDLITMKTTDVWRGGQMGNSGMIRCHRVGIMWVVAA